MTETPELTAPQYAALEALLEGKTQQEAAAQANVDPRTLRRWLAQPEFLLALHQARLSLWVEVVGRIQAHALRAVDALHEAMVNGNSVGARIRAARTLLELGAKALNVESLCAQAALLQSQAESTPGTQSENRTKPDISGHAPAENWTKADTSGQAVPQPDSAGSIAARGLAADRPGRRANHGPLELTRLTRRMFRGTGQNRT